MKRCPELRELSVDHHHGLVLARTARNAACGERSPVEAWTHVATRFAAELEPHFRIEETLLAPALVAAGERELVDRLVGDHAALRHLIAPGSDRSRDRLARFAELLETHIRFEERVLFPVAEQKLPATVLAAVQHACAAQPPREAPRQSDAG